ncbi:MAG: SGNH/GDSL hydrolase family protein [Ectobacillus sp.]
MNEKKKQWIQNLIAAGFIAVTAGVILIGNTSFKTRMEAATKNEVQENTAASAAPSAYQNYMRNLPGAIQEKIKTAVETKKPLQLIIAGDEATGGWPEILEKQLNKAYGKDVFKVMVKSYPQKTTEQWVKEHIHAEIAALHPDILLFEPALLLDGGVVEKAASVTNTQLILEEIQKRNPEAVLLVQPPNPLYGAKHYPETVQMVKQGIEEKGYTYVDHWTAWPQDETLQQYLESPDGFANDKGRQLWAQYMVNYFTAKSAE